MKRTILLAAVLLLVTGTVHAALTYPAANWRFNNVNLTARNGDIYNTVSEIEDLVDGTTGWAKLVLTPNDTAHATTEGFVYYDLSEHTLKYRTNASWVSAGSGTFTGGNVTSDVVLNADGVDILADTTTAHVFAIKGYADAGAYKNVLSMTNGAAVAMVLGASDVTFSVASTGIDIATTGAVSNVTTLAMTGALTGVTTIASSSTITAGAGLILDSAGTITNSTDSEFKFLDAAEDLSLDMDSASNVVGLKSSTGVNGLALGDVDDLSGIGTLAFDAASSTITLAADGADDLTIQVTGVQDSHLVLTAAGTSGDAMQLTTSAGGMDITVGGAAAGEDLDITANSSVNISSTEASADDSIVISAAGAASGIDITSLGDITISTTGADGEDIEITNTGGSIMITATEAIADAIKISATGAVASALAVDIVTTDGGITVAASGAANGDLALSGADDASLTATDDLTLNGGSAGSIINIGTNTHGNVIHIGDNDTTLDSIAIGSAKDTPVTLTGLAVTVGSAAGAASTILQSGTGDISITSTNDWTATASGAVALFSNAVAQTITLGNETGASSLAFKAGTGNIDMQGVAATTITIGDSGQTGTMKFAESSGAMELDIGTGSGVHTVHLADGAGAQVVTVGSTNTTASTTIQSGTGDLALTSTDDITLTVNTTTTDNITLTNTPGTDESAVKITATAGGVNIDAAALKDVDIQGGQVKITGVDNVAGAISLTTATGVSETITITNSVGTGAGAINLTATAGGVSINGGAGDITMASADDFTATAAGTVGLFATAVENLITIGSETGASSLNLKAGTGNIDIQGAAGTTITIGDAAQTAAITIGASTATMTDLSLGTGVGAHTIHIGDGGTAAQVITIGSTSAASSTTLQGGSGGVWSKSGLNAGTAEATCTAVEYSNNGFHRTVLTVVGGTIVLEDKDDGGGALLYTFPQGNVVFLGAFCDLVVTSEATITTSYVMSVGTAAAGDAEATLTSTEADYIASATVTCGAGNEDFHGVSALTAAGLVMVPFNGTGGGKAVYLNAAVAAANISAESDVVGVSGTIVIEWIYLGDF